MTQKNNRDTNFELLRIISMIMVIILHFNNFGGILNNVSPNSKTYFLVNFLEYACIIAVNLYVMISGYYMIKSKMKIKKIIQLELEVIFYSVFIYLAVVLCKQEIFSVKKLIKSFFPILTNQYWFMTAYMGLYILSPFVNKLVNNLSKKEYTVLLLILTVLFSIIKSIYPYNNTFEANGGYGLTWFIYLYLLAGYIRLHWNKNIKKYKLVIAYMVIIFSQVILKKTNLSIIKTYLAYSLQYNSILVLIASVSVFLLFKNIKIENKKINNLILAISPLTLAIYLIHVHKSFNDILWEKLLHPVTYLSSGWTLMIALIVDVAIIFTVCCIIEKLRVMLFNLVGRTKIIQNINNKLDQFTY